MSTGLQNNYLTQHKVSQKETILRDSLKTLKFQLGLKQGMADVLKDEKDMILSNKMIGSETLGVDIEALEDAAEFYRDRLYDINKETLLTNIEAQELKVEIEKLERTLNTVRQAQIKGTGETNYIFAARI